MPYADRNLVLKNYWGAHSFLQKTRYAHFTPHHLDPQTFGAYCPVVRFPDSLRWQCYIIADMTVLQHGQLSSILGSKHLKVML